MTPRNERSSSRKLLRGKHTDGQILVVFAGAAVALILFAGLAVDGGNAFLNRRTAQNVSDLAAVAGTTVIAEFYTKSPSITSADVYNAIASRVAANNCVSTSEEPCSWTASYVDGGEAVTGPVTATGAIPHTSQSVSDPPPTQGVVVHVTRQPRTFFLGVIGQSQWTIHTDATALTARVPSVPPGALLPIAINPPSADEGSEFTLSTGTNYGPGNFGWLTWLNDNGNPILTNSLCNPDNPVVSIGDLVPGNTGTQNSDGVRDCLDQWILSGATILVPLFEVCNDCNGTNSTFRVMGFAAFVLTSYTTSGGAINSLTGRFVGISDLTTVPAGTGSGPPKAGDTSVFLGLIR